MTTCRHIVLSVPHSGSRSLINYLDNVDNSQHFHFGNWRHMASLDRFKHWAHIPIRHPLDVAESWGRRGKAGDVVESLLEQYDAMFEYIRTHSHDLYRIEDIENTAGSDETVEDNPELVLELTEAVEEKVIKPHRKFFCTFYKDLIRGY